MNDATLRQQVLNRLRGHGAHMPFEQAVDKFPPDKINVQPPNVPYTPWHLIEHLRITQWDILEYTRNPDHVSPDWPEGYWPDRNARADGETWEQSIARFLSDLKAMQDIVADPETDLLAPIPHGHEGHTVLREALILADHNAYHVGELAILRQVMDA